MLHNKEVKAPVWAKWKLYSNEDAPSPCSIDERTKARSNERFGETCVTILIAAACVGLLLLCIGAGFYASHNSNERARREGELNAAVDAWRRNNPGQQLRSSEASVELTTTGCDAPPDPLCPCFNSTSPLKPTSKPRDSFRAAGHSLHPYTQLFLSLNTSTPPPNFSYPTTAPPTCHLRVRYLVAGRQLALVDAPLVQLLETRIAGDKPNCPQRLSRDVLAKSTEITNCQTACQALGGLFSSISSSGIGYSCIVPYALKRVCIRVDAAGPGGGLQEVTSRPGPEGGCFPFQKRDALLVGSFRFTPLEQVPLAQGGGVGGVVVELRSADDPWLAFVALTEGTLDFRVRLNRKAQAGLTMLTFGGLLCLLWLPLAYFAHRWLWSPHRFDCPMGLGETLYDGTHKLASRFGKDVHSSFDWPHSLRLELERQDTMEREGKLHGSCDSEAPSEPSARIQVPPLGMASPPHVHSHSSIASFSSAAGSSSQCTSPDSAAAAPRLGPLHRMRLLVHGALPQQRPSCLPAPSRGPQQEDL